MGIISLSTHIQGRSAFAVPKASPIHLWAPRQKLISLVALLFALATIRHHLLLVPVVIITVWLYWLSGLPLGFLLQRLHYPGLFILAVVLLLPFTVGETVLAQWGPISLRREGMETMVLIAGRFASILTIGFILFGTTPFLAMVKAMRNLGLPPLMADMTLLAYRYLYEISDMLDTMGKAMQLRGMGQRQGWSGQRRSFQQWAFLVGNLLLRSYEQSERVYKAMALRGYGQAIPLEITTSELERQRTQVGLTIAVLSMAVGLVMAEVILSIP